MSKRKLTRRQAWRIEKIQTERAARATKSGATTQELLSEGELGPEQQGLVVARHITSADVEGQTNSSQPKRCHLRANLGSLVTGDQVIWRNGNPNGVIVAVLPRHSEFSRPDSKGQIKTIAANIDRIVIVIAPVPQAYANLIDRYLVATETLGIKSIILLNKSDRIDAKNSAYLEALQQPYRQLGYRVMIVSAKTKDRMQELAHYLQDHTSVFVGQSGVGKSSLINALLPQANARVGNLSASAHQGTHTTTTVQLFRLANGGSLIDSPGIREFGLWHIDRQQLLRGFIEFRPFLGKCKFRDCSHQHEPGCAILTALKSGAISEQRVASYHRILASLK